MPEKHSWSKFRDYGLLWFINAILHVFGWAIVLDIEDDKVKAAYPARVRYRGFSLSKGDIKKLFVKHIGIEFDENCSWEVLSE